MNDTTQGAEPNFEGEAIHMPEGTGAVAAKEKSVPMAVILLLFVALLALLVGLYVWYTAMLAQPIVVSDPSLRPTAEENNEPESTTAEAQADSLTVVSSSNELDAIEADIKSTDLSTLESELTAIDGEINTEGSAEAE